MNGSLLNSFDEPPHLSDELPSGEQASHPTAALPRLSIAHLLMWMAATAVAFLPFQLLRIAQQRAESASPAVLESAATTAAYAISGVASGAYLLVAAAAIYWRGRGLLPRYQPGHWLAFKGSLDWVVMSIWMIAYALPHDGNASFAVMLWWTIPQLLRTLAILIGFLWLSWGSRDGARWRCTFFFVAVAPVLEMIGPALIAAFLGPAGFIVAMMGGRAIIEIAQALTLAGAITGDKRRLAERHWSHWMASGAFLLALLANAAIYTWYSLSPDLLRAQ